MRQAIRPYFALLLLLCFARTLLPEAWVLVLHRHAHTAELAAARRPVGKELASPRHTHCHVEQFYNVPFQAALPVAVPQPRLRARYVALAAPAQVACQAATRCTVVPRGPPQA